MQMRTKDGYVSGMIQAIQFQRFLRGRIADNLYGRAMDLYQNFLTHVRGGELLLFLTAVLMQAVHLQKTSEALAEFERHWTERLCRDIKNPDITSTLAVVEHIQKKVF